MILTELTIQGFGPFYKPATIKIDPEVTILTGRNDVGKTAILDAIKVMFDQERASESQVNLSGIRDSARPHDKDPDVQCEAVFNVSGLSSNHFTLNKGNEKDIDPQLEIDQIKMSYALTLGRVRDKEFFKNGELTENFDISFSGFPKAPLFPMEHEISQEIHFESENELDQALIHAAFGLNAFPRLGSLSETNVHILMDEGNKKLNEALLEFLPPQTQFEFRLHKLEGAPLRFSVSLADSIGGYTPITSRGAGVRKILTTLLALNSLNHTNEHVVVLFDEPENSLHADSQHVLRQFLEELASNKTVQVIYATHSPSMINSYKTRGLRLVKRIARNNDATSVIENKPIGDNFSKVRIHLGISAADSLLYAPINVIVEGTTEARNLADLLAKLCEAEIEEFADVNELLPLSIFFNGKGTNIPTYWKILNEHGVNTVIFADGDNQQILNKIERECPGVPLVHLPAGIEFEQLIPTTTYFEALIDVFGEEATQANFEQWKDKNKDLEQYSFTKQISKWLEDKYPQTYYDKPEIMNLAISKVDASAVQKEKLAELIAEMGKLAQSLEHIRQR